MARTITEIATAIKSDFVGNATLRSAYNLTASKTFDEQFSSVSLEAAIIYIVSVAIWTIERLSEDFNKEVDTRISEAYITSHKWYWRRALEYQDGVDIQFDEKTLTYGYRSIDETKQIIKYAAVTDEVTQDRTKLKIQVAGPNKKAITTVQLTRFSQYMSRIGAAGMSYSITSEDALKVYPQMTVYIDSLSINPDGTRVGAPVRPIDDVIINYLDSIEYGGLFSANQLCTIVQAVVGVIEVKFTNLKTSNSTLVGKDGDVRIISPTGSFEYYKENTGITYIPTLQ